MMSPDELVDVLAERVLTLELEHPARVGIDGRSASGKSTLASALTRRIAETGRPCVSASIDDFHPPGYARRAAEGAFADASEFFREGYDFESFRRLVLDPAGPGGSRRCRLRLWDARADEAFPVEWVEIPDDAVLVAEAAFLFLPVLADAWDLSIWLDIDAPTMFKRVIDRDVAWVGSTDEVRKRYERSWAPRHELYEREAKPIERADIVIDNRDPERPRLIRPR
jgi:uridine kinase